ncbi:hypothetical protein [Saccharopolyspora shandongensis]|uniref:hypothetical protein n=1 Tax=Saccharopolyspora shandongensis TaxID=418495 RepID=UPI0034049F27
MTTPNTITLNRIIAYVKWVWITGSIFTILLSGGLIFLYVDPAERLVLAVAFAVNLVQSALAVIAAINLKPGRNWARVTLIILGFVCLVSIYQSITNEMWVSLILNLVLGSTAPVLLRRDVQAAFAHRQSDVDQVAD